MPDGRARACLPEPDQKDLQAMPAAPGEWFRVERSRRAYARPRDTGTDPLEARLGVSGALLVTLGRAARHPCSRLGWYTPAGWMWTRATSCCSSGYAAVTPTRWRRSWVSTPRVSI